MELLEQLGKYPEIQLTLCITFKWCLEREICFNIIFKDASVNDNSLSDLCKHIFLPHVLYVFSY